jgi:RHS repeat-associated protein
MTDVNGAQTSYTYNACNGSYPDTISEPLSLTRTLAWDCFGGAVTSVLDENSQTSTYAYYDPFRRITKVTDPLENTTTYTYTPTTMESVLAFVNPSCSTCTVDKLTTVDGLGRPYLQQTRQQPAPYANFDTVVTTYDKVGRVASVGMPCVSTASQPCSSAVTTTTYDAISRPQLVTDGGGGTAAYTYTSKDVLMTLGPAPSGENAKRRQLEYDALGRLTSLCEVTAGTATWPGGTCAQNSAQTGYWTKYTNDGLNRLTSTTQNAQSSTSQGRTYAYDGLNRLTSEMNPESGTKTYIYDTESSCGPNGSFASSGDLLQTTDADGYQICYYYDALHRIFNVGNNVQSSMNFCKRFRYDAVSNGYRSAPSGYPSQPYAAGRLIEAETDDCSGTLGNLITDEWFSYNADGQMTGMWELTPHSGQYYYANATIAANGAVTSMQLASPSLYTMTWGLDGEGRLNTLTDTTSNKTLVGGATYWPSTYSPKVTLTGTDNDSYTIDLNTGRMTQYAFTVGSSSMTGNVNWNSNGTLNQLAITDGFNSGGTQTCNYNQSTVSGTGYDDLSRLVGVDCGSGQWGQTYSYDPFGNLTQEQMSGRQGTTWNPGYNESNNHCTGCSYDSDGNVLGDGNYVYGWNVYSKLAWAATSGTPTCGTSGRCIAYDAFGRIVEWSSGSTWYERWITQVGETAYMSGATINYGFWPAPGGGKVVMTSTTSYGYMHPNWLGNAMVVSNLSSHVITHDQAYSPFGQMYDGYDAPSAEYYEFAGLTGNFYSGVTWEATNRELSDFSGRWLSPDPAGLSAVDSTNPQSWNRYAYALNNPLRYTDPSGLYCFYGGAGDTPENDSDPTDYDFAATGPGDCGEGGQWIDTSTVVNVNSDGSVGPTLEDGQLIFPEVVPLQQSFANCVKNGGDAFSLANGLNSITGGRTATGTAGALNNAFLGNTVSDVIGLFQGETGSMQNIAISEGGPKAATTVATVIPDVASTTTTVTTVSVQSSALSVSLTAVETTSNVLPIGTLARTATSFGTEALESFTNLVKLPIDLTASSFSTVVCSIGR